MVLVERAYAKINLTLDVLRKRPDGYHEVDMVMQTVDLSDLIWMDVKESGIHLDSGASNIPLDDRNLAYVAAQKFLQTAQITSGVTITLEKNIPVAAGLAGGSSDAAAVLRGLNRLFDTGYSVDKLAEMGASIGSDVPFCVYGGSAVAKGRGEQLTRFRHNLKAWAIIVRPPVFVSTADVYGALTPDSMSEQPRSQQMVDALLRCDFEQVVGLVSNGLRPAAERLYPEVKEYADRLSSTIGQPVHMSGSGPTLFILTPTLRRAQRTYNAIPGFMKEVYLCRLI